MPVGRSPFQLEVAFFFSKSPIWARDFLFSPATHGLQAMVKKGKKMEVEDGAKDAYVYGGSDGSGKKKGSRKLKLSRKQIKRKALHRERGEAVTDRKSSKIVKDVRKAERRLAAKDLW